jgi:hypothetical protein
LFRNVIKLLIGAIFLTSCSLNKLSVRTDYLSHENLASYIINTPDPLLDNPPIGQRLIVNWLIPNTCLKLGDLHIDVVIRFRNKEEVSETFAVHSSSGQYIYKLLNTRYLETEGIQTYKVELKSGNTLIEEWRHQLWVELIRFDQTSTQEDLDEE